MGRRPRGHPLHRKGVVDAHAHPAVRDDQLLWVPADVRSPSPRNDFARSPCATPGVPPSLPGRADRQVGPCRRIARRERFLGSLVDGISGAWSASPSRLGDRHGDRVVKAYRVRGPPGTETPRRIPTSLRFPASWADSAEPIIHFGYSDRGCDGCSDSVPVGRTAQRCAPGSFVALQVNQGGQLEAVVYWPSPEQRGREISIAPTGHPGLSPLHRACRCIERPTDRATTTSRYPREPNGVPDKRPKAWPRPNTKPCPVWSIGEESAIDVAKNPPRSSEARFYGRGLPSTGIPSVAILIRRVDRLMPRIFAARRRFPSVWRRTRPIRSRSARESHSA